METDEFDGLLQLARLKNKDFEIINNMHKGSILNWKKKEIPRRRGKGWQKIHQKRN